MTGFTLPDLGEGIKEAEIVSWHVAEGDHVVADQPLVSVETDKAVVEIPSPRSGCISKLLVKPGERVKVGTPLVEFENGAHPDAGTVVGNLTVHTKPSEFSQITASPRETIVATPAIRAFAKDRGVDLHMLRGTGPGGAITRNDVIGAAAPATAEGEPLRGVRLSMARNMAEARASVVPASLYDDADIERWWSPTADFTARLIRAVASACTAVPALNVRFDAPLLLLRRNAQINLGMAIDTEAGLIVAVLRDVGGKDLNSLRRDLDDLKTRVRARSVAPSELKDATITLSNFGALAGQHATLVVMPPQVAIVGAGRADIKARPAAKDIAFRHFLPLSITFDHRVVDGAEAARFMKAMIEDLALDH
ncbi:MAG TPA: dihydrolipoamide acetyltransferase family protein [Stellaceae bacterium]|jgi:2-oxoisovalerate dehydrogenase E2 component (dihydrolipoyl transacylase)|nr:dihydrolipoamide acetyltransferase family protein [Stellaceae bacterium]